MGSTALAQERPPAGSVLYVDDAAVDYERVGANGRRVDTDPQGETRLNVLRIIDTPAGANNDYVYFQFRDGTFGRIGARRLTQQIERKRILTEAPDDLVRRIDQNLSNLNQETLTGRVAGGRAACPDPVVPPAPQVPAIPPTSSDSPPPVVARRQGTPLQFETCRSAPPPPNDYLEQRLQTYQTSTFPNHSIENLVSGAVQPVPGFSIPGLSACFLSRLGGVGHRFAYNCTRPGQSVSAWASNSSLRALAAQYETCAEFQQAAVELREADQSVSPFPCKSRNLIGSLAFQYARTTKCLADAMSRMPQPELSVSSQDFLKILNHESKGWPNVSGGANPISVTLSNGVERTCSVPRPSFAAGFTQITGDAVEDVNQTILSGGRSLNPTLHIDSADPMCAPLANVLGRSGRIPGSNAEPPGTFCDRTGMIGGDFSKNISYGFLYAMRVKRYLREDPQLFGKLGRDAPALVQSFAGPLLDLLLVASYNAGHGRVMEKLKQISFSRVISAQPIPTTWEGYRSRIEQYLFDERVYNPPSSNYPQRVRDEWEQFQQGAPGCSIT